MVKYQLIFCVLTYKNYIDIKEFIENINNKAKFTYKIVVANSYSDEKSSKEIRNIAISSQCDFIEFENKGYGYGNNRAIEYAKNNYDYEYLVVCNPDTLILNFDYQNLQDYNKEIIAPSIISAKGRRQNPMNVTYMPIAEWVLFNAFKKQNRYLFYLGVGLIKIKKFIDIFLKKLNRKKKYKIHICHGSFIIFSKYSVDKLIPIFDENIFLFGEEGDLGRKIKLLDLDIVYDEDIKIFHKEDGSMKLSDFNLNKILQESFIYYYEKWRSI